MSEFVSAGLPPWEQMLRLIRKLPAWRQLAGLSQKKLADSILVTKATIQSWEAGKTTPTLVTAKLLGDALNIPPGALDSDFDPEQEVERLRVLTGPASRYRDGRVIPGHRLPFCGKRLRAARLAKTWSQEKLAKASGYDLSSFSRWESGDRYPSSGVILDIAHALGVSEAELAPPAVPEESKEVPLA